jgi:endoglucanase Acf2
MMPAAALVLLLLVTGCTFGGASKQRPASPGGPADLGNVTEGTAKAPLATPQPGGLGSLATTMPANMRPTKVPAQAGENLTGQALPTNQWWTSALTGPLSQPIWAHPLAVRAAAAGIEVSAAAPAASANAVITPFQPAVTAGGPIASLRVIGYGAFHVVLLANLAGGGAVEVTLVQGSPLLYLRFTGTAPALAVTGAVKQVAGGAGKGSPLRLDIAGQRWDILAENGARWHLDGNQVTASDAGGGRVVVAPVPDGVDTTAWDSAIADSAADPIVQTTATMTYANTSGGVTQTLSTTRKSGRPGVWALLPHQHAGLVPGGSLRTIAGTYPDARGPLSLVLSDAITVRVPMPGMLTAVPSVPLSATAHAAVVADLNKDLADPPNAGGSYFGLKELGRLATIAEVAKGAGADPQYQAALTRLRPQLVDWLTYSGGGDGRYFAYDQVWGGLIAIPAEFGSGDYNDHHFQYGYLVRAAAVLAQADPTFLRDYGQVVDLVVRDYSGALSVAGPAGFPPYRVFNAYLGHSAASGFAPFADGNNQESTSEAVAAWEAVVRWGLVRQNPDLVTYGVEHYALEAATARTYWLGEGVSRPAGYAHTSAGIVWDAKIDYATWFDPRPESIQGIQLLPLTFGSLYRADPKAAAARSAELHKQVGGDPRVWGDLFAADLALTDPAAARRRLSPDLPREPSTSRAFVRYWVEMLAAFGPPQPTVTADGPYGLAFGSRDKPTLVAVNQTGARRTLTFRSDGKVAASVSLEPGQRVSQRQ